MRQTRFTWSILLVLAALLGSAWIAVSRAPVTTPAAPISLTEAPIVGYHAPDFTLTSPIGKSYTLSEIIAQNGAAGQPVVLNFWASWCGPCRLEMPYFQNLSLKYNGRIGFIGVNQGESAQIVTDFGNEYNITYPLLADPDNTVNLRYDVRSLPTTVLIDRSGLVREVIIGAISQGTLEIRLLDLLSEPAPQTN